MTDRPRFDDITFRIVGYVIRKVIRSKWVKVLTLYSDVLDTRVKRDGWRAQNL